MSAMVAMLSTIRVAVFQPGELIKLLAGRRVPHHEGAVLVMSHDETPVCAVHRRTRGAMTSQHPDDRCLVCSQLQRVPRVGVEVLAGPTGHGCGLLAEQQAQIHVPSDGAGCA